MENVKGKAQGIWKKYWDVNAGLSHPSKSIKRIAKVFYYFYLVAGIVGAAAALQLVQTQGDAGDVVTGLLHEQGGNRAVHAAAHGHRNRLVHFFTALTHDFPQYITPCSSKATVCVPV